MAHPGTYVERLTRREGLPDAGEPDGDEVLVLFLKSDPERGRESVGAEPDVGGTVIGMPFAFLCIVERLRDTTTAGWWTPPGRWSGWVVGFG